MIFSLLAFEEHLGGLFFILAHLYICFFVQFKKNASLCVVHLLYIPILVA